MRVLGSFLVGVLLAVVGAGWAAAADGDSGFTIKDPRITESSGLAASRAHPGIYWTHNDSDDGPYLYAVDSKTGKTVATVTMKGVGRPRDVEAISMGPHDTLYVGDIGDNLGGKWDHVWIYKLPEPKELKDQTVDATQYDVRYANGPRDAEALMVHPVTGRVYIAEKNQDGGSLYAGPAKLSTSGMNIFRKTATIDLWVTDGAFSPDGRHLALRGYFGGILYDWKDGGPKRKGRLTVPLQQQGESVTYTTDGRTLLYGSEGTNSKVQARGVPGTPDSGSSHGGKDVSELKPDYTKGAMVLVLALVVIFGGKRVLRRK
ncbi:WD40 repeat domain-containing protein [Streptomyces sp. NPDC050560]|uniref:WD40 repeat domain-containing protein n=1 Tax=Streptomyces sp. NPDC050560 TaxID=3365630 RepID=UPI0037AD8443